MTRAIIPPPLLSAVSTESGRCRLLASSSKDGDVRVWDARLQTCLRSLTSHTQSVTALRWGGAGLLFSGSQDRTVKVWSAEDVSGWQIRERD